MEDSQTMESRIPRGKDGRAERARPSAPNVTFFVTNRSCIPV